MKVILPTFAEQKRMNKKATAIEIADYRRALILAPDKTTSDQIKAALKRLGYVENGLSAESGRAARRNRR